MTAFARLTKSISKGTQKLVPLQEELALLNDYFTIQQYRYGGDLEIEVSRIESETLCRDCMIPRFTLQPLVENAIFHGLEPKGGHGSVLLDISTDPDTGDVCCALPMTAWVCRRSRWRTFWTSLPRVPKRLKSSVMSACGT